ncbi:MULTISPECIES: hypothetical protein [unclassified Streptomyces]|uniref:hypothetical protein n=1 Tax=unclassified Streptomyces TaxID=2593676 RepID=UPI00336A61E0
MTGGDDHLAGFDVPDGHGDQVAPQKAASVVSRHQGDGPAVGDDFELVLEGAGPNCPLLTETGPRPLGVYAMSAPPPPL